MSVWIWETKDGFFHEILLWDGYHTYWSDEMKPSGGYNKMRTYWCKITRSRFVYIGEL